MQKDIEGEPTSENQDNIAKEKSSETKDGVAEEQPPKTKGESMEKLHEEIHELEEAVETEAPKRIMRIGKGEPIFRILCSLIIALIFLGFPYLIGFWASDLLWEPPSFLATPRGYWIPLFDLILLDELWFIIILWTLTCITGEIIKMVISCYNKKYAVTTTVTGVLLLIFTGIVFLNPYIYNYGFVPLLDEYFDNTIPEFVVWALEYSNYIIFVILCIIVIIEIIFAWYRNAKYGGSIPRKKKEKDIPADKKALENAKASDAPADEVTNEEDTLPEEAPAEEETPAEKETKEKEAKEEES